MKSVFAFPLAALLAAVATPALAQYDWDGLYINVHGGNSTQSDSSSEVLNFDTDGDGNFDNGVSSDPVLLINAFNGSCGGSPNTGYVQALCRGNFDDKAGDNGIRIGWDWQSLDLVYGVVAEHASNGLTDSVTVFSTTQRTYTFHRELGDVTALRGRVGFTFGDGSNLLYATWGLARASISNRFVTTDPTPTFTTSNEEATLNGTQFGVGYETFVTKHLTMGLEWMSTGFDDDSEFTVHADGGIFDNDDPTTGTDIRRSNESMDFSSTRLTFGYRFNDGDW
jgi:outer membrane immunogenic protein